MNLRRVTNQKINLIKDENGDLPVYSHNILNRWKTDFVSYCKYEVNDIMWTEIQELFERFVDWQKCIAVRQTEVESYCSKL
jgi:hypothetical protein